MTNMSTASGVLTDVSVSGNNATIGEAAVVAGTSTSVTFQLDYDLMQRVVVR